MEIKPLIICLFVSVIIRSGLTFQDSNSTTKSLTQASTPSTQSGNTSSSPLPTRTTTSSPTTNTTTTPPPVKDKCTLKTNCATCVENYKCYWCEPSKKCVTYPANKITPRSCDNNEWYWKQCTVPGYVLIIVVPCLAVLILLTCGCCIYCKCCRTKSSNKEEERIKRRRQEMKDRNEERRRERNNRTDQIRQKYGLLKSEDSEPLI